MINRILTPFLIGQRRDGLCRIREIDTNNWDILTLPEFHEKEIEDSNEKLRRMGKIYFTLSEKIRKTINAGQLPISVAGDCISTLGVLSGLQKAGKEPGCILWLDAHGDFHTWETSSTKYIGGMPLAMLVGRSNWHKENKGAVTSMLAEIGATPYPEGNVILSDARDLDFGEKEALQQSKIKVCNISDIVKTLPSNKNIYLHWDTDVVDAESETPALKYHVKNGPSYIDIENLFKSISDRKIVAVSISAWHEEKDTENKAAIACLNALSCLKVSS